MSNKTKAKPAITGTILTATVPVMRVMRLICDDELNRQASDYRGRVRCSINRIPDDCAPQYQDFSVTIEMVDRPAIKAKRSRKAKEAA